MMKSLVLILLMFGLPATASLTELKGIYDAKTIRYDATFGSSTISIHEVDGKSLIIGTKSFALKQPILSAIYTAEVLGRQFLVIKTSAWNSRQAIAVVDIKADLTKAILYEEFPSEVTVEVKGERGLGFSYSENRTEKVNYWRP